MIEYALFVANAQSLTGRQPRIGDDRMSNGEGKRIRVGIIGANPDRGWAAQAHIPALKSLSDDFEITALSTSRRESADAAATRFGVRRAFDNHDDLVNSADVDVVAITVKVPSNWRVRRSTRARPCTANGHSETV